MADRDNETDDRDDDEAWLAQLRTALASAGDVAEADDTAEVDPERTDSTEPPGGFTRTWPEPLVVRPAMARDIQSALGELTQRIAELEALVRQLTDRPTPSPQREDVDAFVEQVADAVAARLGARGGQGLFDPVAPPEALRETGDLGGIVERLEAQQRRLLEELAVDRQRLISDAVAEIRTLLFGK